MSIEQGRLGDCWFLSAVAVLTEVSRISEVIITPEYNEEGIYTVRFCIQVISFVFLFCFFLGGGWGEPMACFLFLTSLVM